MSDQNELNKQNNTIPAANEAEQISSELSESELDNISGGPTAVENVIVFTKPLQLANSQIANNAAKH